MLRSKIDKLLDFDVKNKMYEIEVDGSEIEILLDGLMVKWNKKLA